MRNLKRTLSLALAAVMVISMMVIGAGATSFNDFPDKSEIKNQDAVSLLTTLGIINGKDSGKFDPTGNVTRAEMAKMLSVVMNSGADNNALYADMNTKLTDIGSSWAKGHINFCYSRNIITGRGNNAFDPTANVTAAEAAKMLLVAAGYNPTTEGFVGSSWSINVSAMASKLGIFKNFENGKLMQPLSRDDAALLIYNTMDVEMIEKYESGYALVYEDSRTILSTMYGVYKAEGVVVSNEWASLNKSDNEVALSKDKSTLDDIKVYASTTSNTANQDYEVEKLPQTFKVSTSVDMLGKTVTMYIRKTTVLSNSEVLGVYVKDGVNTVKTITNTQDTMKDALKGSGISVDKDTEYYVNYGYKATEIAATTEMGFETKTPADDRFTSLNGKTNGSGVNMDVIDNNGDGVADYVLYTQETLTQVTSVNTAKEKTTLNGFNKNGSIDNTDIVVADAYKEGDLVLANEYGGRYYVSAPEVITGKMDSFSSSKTKQQYIEVSGTKYNPSYAVFQADAADNTNLFNILKCGTADGVDFDITYDFVLDTLGNVIAFLPSEKGIGNYALILDSGYDPGRSTSNPSGEVKVLLSDGTEATYNLNFGASASNIGKQLHSDKITSASVQKDAGIVELKALLGSTVQDTTSTNPYTPDAIAGVTFKFAGTNTASIYNSGHAKGYVVEYGINEEKVMTIKSIVGSNIAPATATHYNPTVNIKDETMTVAYESGSSRIKYGPAATDQVAVDQNTVAFYYVAATAGVSAKYGVAVGYTKMSNVAISTDFVAQTHKDTNLANAVLFNAEGVAAEKDYVYVLGRTTSISGFVTLNVILADGKASTLKVERDHYDSIFGDDTAYNNAYSYSTNGKGVSELSTSGSTALYGYALKLNNGTVALYSDKTCKTLIDTYSYDKNIWNVEDVSAGENAPGGAFSTSSAKETVLVLDSKRNVVRAAYIKSTVDGTISGGGGSVLGLKAEFLGSNNIAVYNPNGSNSFDVNAAISALLTSNGFSNISFSTLSATNIVTATKSGITVTYTISAMFPVHAGNDVTITYTVGGIAYTIQPGAVGYMISGSGATATNNVKYTTGTADNVIMNTSADMMTGTGSTTTASTKAGASATTPIKETWVRAASVVTLTGVSAAYKNGATDVAVTSGHAVAVDTALTVMSSAATANLTIQYTEADGVLTTTSAVANGTDKASFAYTVNAKAVAFNEISSVRLMALPTGVTASYTVGGVTTNVPVNGILPAGQVLTYTGATGKTYIEVNAQTALHSAGKLAETSGAYAGVLSNANIWVYEAGKVTQSSVDVTYVGNVSAALTGVSYVKTGTALTVMTSASTNGLTLTKDTVVTTNRATGTAKASMTHTVTTTDVAFAEAQYRAVAINGSAVQWILDGATVTLPTVTGVYYNANYSGADHFVKHAATPAPAITADTTITTDLYMVTVAAPTGGAGDGTYTLTATNGHTITAGTAAYVKAGTVISVTVTNLGSDATYTVAVTGDTAAVLAGGAITATNTPATITIGAAVTGDVTVSITRS